MPKHEGNAHGRHYTEEERENDEQRNHNDNKGRQHFEEPENHIHTGGHSDKHASAASDNGGQFHDLAKPGDPTDDINQDDKPQDDGRRKGAGRNEGGHQGGRHQHN